MREGVCWPVGSESVYYKSTEVCICVWRGMRGVNNWDMRLWVGWLQECHHIVFFRFGESVFYVDIVYMIIYNMISKCELVEY